ncbi:protein phosphatase [Lithospermum erythrorhizon]|uniref:acid phosphatase n=1 Tax=Lithospermum erythrorhizon TaxID=34254 RepID=A0AAV3RA50_LITER
MRILYNGLSTTTPTIITPKLPPLPTPKSSPFHLTFQHPTHKNPTFIKNQNKKPTNSTTPKASMDSSSDPETKPISVLFVCLGNICRSPAAEGVFRHLVNQKGLQSNFNIDSAGTINYHEGNEADSRMRAASQRRGIPITSISRPIRPSDFKDFDLILAMDKQNKEDILSAFERWSYKQPLPADAAKKVRLMCSYCKRHSESEVPDPYYGGPQGFEKVLDILEDGCESLLDSILAEKSNLVGSQ